MHITAFYGIGQEFSHLHFFLFSFVDLRSSHSDGSIGHAKGWELGYISLDLHHDLGFKIIWGRVWG